MPPTDSVLICVRCVWLGKDDVSCFSQIIQLLHFMCLLRKEIMLINYEMSGHLTRVAGWSGVCVITVVSPSVCFSGWLSTKKWR